MASALHPEAAQHLVHAVDELAYAREGFSNGHYRGATSRAYYAMYNASRAALIQKGVATKTHAGLLKGVAEHLVKPGGLPLDLFRGLQRVHEMRQSADYDVLHEVGGESCADAIRSATD